jgi:Domain of unknown function (DUF5916)
MKKNIFLFLILCALRFYSQENTNAIPYQAVDIDLDGKLEEAIWQTLPEYTNFKKFFPIDQGEAENQTKVKVFHNGKDLYIGVVYSDNESRNFINSLKRDDHYNSIVISDAFGVVIDPYSKQQSGYYFCVNAGGALVDALIEYSGSDYDVNTSWNSVWNAKSNQIGNEKIYEMKIPLKALNFDAKNKSWNLQFFTRDTKINLWSSYAKLTNNLLQFDLRYTTPFSIDHLDNIKNSVLAITPSITGAYLDDINSNKKQASFTPSLDIQYNLTQALRLDATINPDFSQVDVDQQVTNLSRFSIYFPERRNFFLEASDLFNNLGTESINPFYSRRIGAATPIIAGLKFSGNLHPKMRIGVLNVQTKEKKNLLPENFSTVVLQNNLSKQLTSTAYFINKQNTFTEKNNDYNRLVGFNLNFISKDNKTTANIKSSKSFSLTPNKKNYFAYTGIAYNSRKVTFGSSLEYIGENYITDVGFAPRLYNYDALTDKIIRNGYLHHNIDLSLYRFPTSKIIDFHRYAWIKNDVYTNEKGELIENNLFLNNAWFLKNSSRAYINGYYDLVNLPYAFSPLSNGNEIRKGQYHNAYARFGYQSPINKRFSINTNVQYGNYYNGKLFRYFIASKYNVASFANILVDYELNVLKMNELGNENFHLLRLTSEIFFTNRLNWTTYFQYNTQAKNVNINSRLQWEYKPLSYVYFVVTNNLDERLKEKNWGLALKTNYRLDR